MNTLPANPLAALPAHSGSADSVHVLTALQTNTSAWAKRAQPLPNNSERPEAVTINPALRTPLALLTTLIHSRRRSGGFCEIIPSLVRTVGERPRDVLALAQAKISTPGSNVSAPIEHPSGPRVRPWYYKHFQ